VTAGPISLRPLQRGVFKNFKKCNLDHKPFHYEKQKLSKSDCVY
jgi:hypothetical protein